MPLIERYFAGKTAAISGAGDGIGRALSQRLNAAGCHLWLSDINPETLAAASVSGLISESQRWQPAAFRRWLSALPIPSPAPEMAAVLPAK